MRTREVWLHLVDLDAGPSVDVIPDDVAVELVTDVASWMSPKLTDAVMLRPDGQPSVHLGVEDAEPKATVSGPAARIAGWLTGRTPADRLDADGTVPPLPRWL
jgi:maleylpyruvate isomerase